jgi:PAS domain S-box-containing protein
MNRNYGTLLTSLLKRHKIDFINGKVSLCEERSASFLNELDEVLEGLDKEKREHELEHDRLRLILDHTPCTISWIDRDLNYIGVNNALSELCGLKSSDFLGKQAGFFTKNKFFYNFSHSLFEKQGDLQGQEIEIDFQAMGQKKFWFTGVTFNNHQNAIIIGVDITELNVLRDQLAFNDKLVSLGEMMAGIVHEINNPLSVVFGRLEIIKKDTQDEKVHKSVEKISNTCKKIVKIIKGIKNFVRHGANDEKCNISTQEILDESLLICESKIKDHSVNIINDCENLEEMINCNETQIFQVFVNLINNAIDAISSRDEKWIKISTIPDDDSLQIAFTDSGEGIPLDIQEDMFKSFFTTKGKGVGTGIGLSLCQKILEEHNGRLYVDNDSPNTSFVVVLPRQL